MSGLSYGAFLLLSSGLLAIGIFGILTRRNFILLLISLEIGMNATILNFVFFGAFSGGIVALTGQAIAVVLIGFGAIEVAVGLAIVLALHRTKGTTNVAEASLLRF